MKNPSRIRFLTEAGLIAAAYLALTALSSLFGLAYGPVQCRFSEALCLLPVLSSASIPGLCIGCLLANIPSALGPFDMLFGTLATLLAAVLVRLTRNIRLRVRTRRGVQALPLLGALIPPLCNGLIVGAELMFFLPGGPSGLLGFLSAAAGVALGELCVCLFLGLPLTVLLEKTGLFPSR